MSLSSAQTTIASYGTQRKALASTLASLKTQLRLATAQLQSLINSNASSAEISAQEPIVSSLSSQVTTATNNLKQLNTDKKAALSVIATQVNVALPITTSSASVVPKLFDGPQGPTGPTGPPVNVVIDTVPTSSSTHAITSGGVYAALASATSSMGGITVGTSSGGDANTALLLHFEPTATSTDVEDSSWYRHPQSAISSTTTLCYLNQTTYKFGTSALYSATASTGINIDNFVTVGTGDFTVECWAYFAAIGSTPQYLLQIGPNFNVSVITGKLQFYLGSTTQWTYSFLANTWYHIAVVRQAGTITGYVNGTSVGSVSNTGSVPNAIFTVGNNANAYIDELRLSTSARYTSNFTSPTAAFADAFPTPNFPASSTVGQLWSDGSSIYVKTGGWLWSRINSISGAAPLSPTNLTVTGTKWYSATITATNDSVATYITVTATPSSGTAISTTFSAGSPYTLTGLSPSTPYTLSMVASNYYGTSSAVTATSTPTTSSMGNWTTRTSPADNYWRSVCWSKEKGIFVAVASGNSGSSSDKWVMTSPDGIAWTAQATPNVGSSVCWSAEKGLFVAVATTGTTKVMTSPDGITWTARTTPNAGSSVCWSAEKGLFVAVNSSGTVMTSSDGITWTSRTSAANNGWYSVCWSKEMGLFVAVAAYTGTGNRVMTSPDGITWTSRTSAADNNWNSVCWSKEKGLFVAVAFSGTGNRVMTSPDGITWTLRTAPADNWWVSVCWAKEAGLFVAVAQSGTGNRVMTSPDGITWTLRTSAVDNDWNSVCWSPELGRFVAVATSGTGNRVMTLE